MLPYSAASTIVQLSMDQGEWSPVLRDEGFAQHGMTSFTPTDESDVFDKKNTFWKWFFLKNFSQSRVFQKHLKKNAFYLLVSVTSN